MWNGGAILEHRVAILPWVKQNFHDPENPLLTTHPPKFKTSVQTNVCIQKFTPALLNGQKEKKRK
jgi:hypothetical protein